MPARVPANGADGSASFDCRCPHVQHSLPSPPRSVKELQLDGAQNGTSRAIDPWSLELPMDLSESSGWSPASSRVQECGDLAGDGLVDVGPDVVGGHQLGIGLVDTVQGVSDAREHGGGVIDAGRV